MSRLKMLFGKITGVVLLFLLTLSGCKKDPDIIPDMFADVRFSINAMIVDKPDDMTKSLNSLFDLKSLSINPEEITNVRLGIDGTHDNPLETKLLDYNISDGITDPIKLLTGDHQLVSIELLKEVEPDVYEILYSGVAEGSPLSSFVQNTLPISFSIPLLDAEYVEVDVVALDDWAPEDFGWGIFSIGLKTVYPLYFYGADDAGNASVMSMDVYSGNVLISSSELTVQGWTKVLYVDEYNIPDENEIYTFKLVKDGVEYARDWSVAELKSLPREVILLNVYGSGMSGFVELIYYDLTFVQVGQATWPGSSFMASYSVVNEAGIEVYNSGSMTTGSNLVQYLDGPEDDVDEFYTITINYQLFNDGPGTWLPAETKSAYVPVSTLKGLSTITLDARTSTYNFWMFN